MIICSEANALSENSFFFGCSKSDPVFAQGQDVFSLKRNFRFEKCFVMGMKQNDSFSSVTTIPCVLYKTYMSYVCVMFVPAMFEF